MKSVKNILIIDGHRSSLDLARKLSRKGFSVSRALTPRDGLAGLADAKPDLVLVSVGPEDDSGL
ncbi:MAG TPA: DNA-binding response regulator, partial [Deltaproteobacteria bacterium]|nr:DNA-binding response regulator [Deltaproteobacteria bacterium]